VMLQVTQTVVFVGFAAFSPRVKATRHAVFKTAALVHSATHPSKTIMK